MAQHGVGRDDARVGVVELRPQRAGALVGAAGAQDFIGVEADAARCYGLIDELADRHAVDLGFEAAIDQPRQVGDCLQRHVRLRS